jgi:hypothetical protein
MDDNPQSRNSVHGMHGSSIRLGAATSAAADAESQLMKTMEDGS